jgi:DNA-binding transcriptional ArsR family regulator
MTDPTAPGAGTSTQVDPATEKRGRPRPQDTVARDEAVAQLVREKGPLSRTQIAEQMGITPSIAYMSLFRLRRDGYVRRAAGAGGDAKSHTWEIVNK